MEVSTPAAISTGIEVWTWVIAEKNDIEVALMSELLSSWSDSIRQEKGIFSPSLKSAFHSSFVAVAQMPVQLRRSVPFACGLQSNRKRGDRSGDGKRSEITHSACFGSADAIQPSAGG